MRQHDERNESEYDVWSCIQKIITDIRLENFNFSTFFDFMFYYAFASVVCFFSHDLCTIECMFFFQYIQSGTVNNRFSVQVFMIVFIIMKGHQSVNQNIHSFNKKKKMPSAKEIFIEINKCHNLMLCFNHIDWKPWMRYRFIILSRCHIYEEIHIFFPSHPSIRRKQDLFVGFLVALFIGKHLKINVVKIYKETSFQFFAFIIRRVKKNQKREQIGSQWWVCGSLLSIIYSRRWWMHICDNVKKMNCSGNQQ